MRHYAEVEVWYDPSVFERRDKLKCASSMEEHLSLKEWKVEEDWAKYGWCCCRAYWPTWHRTANSSTSYDRLYVRSVKDCWSMMPQSWREFQSCLCWFLLLNLTISVLLHFLTCGLDSLVFFPPPCYKFAFRTGVCCLWLLILLFFPEPPLHRSLESFIISDFLSQVRIQPFSHLCRQPCTTEYRHIVEF